MASGYAKKSMGRPDAVAGTSIGTLNPSGTATREQFAMIFNSFWDRMGDR